MQIVTWSCLRSVLGKLCLISMLIGGACWPANAATVNLAWDANTETDLAGYNLYRITGACTTQGPLAFTGKVGTVAKVVIATDTVTADGTYCYELTAFDTASNESKHSNRAEAIVNVNPPQAPVNLRVTGVTP